MANILNKESLYSTLFDLFKDEDKVFFDQHEEVVEEYTNEATEHIIADMQEYAHKQSTEMCGNFANITCDWDSGNDMKSGVTPWDDFHDILERMDNDRISNTDIEKVQTWALHWFFNAFGTFGLRYNYQNFVSEYLYNEEEDEEECIPDESDPIMDEYVGMPDETLPWYMKENK